MTTYFVDTAGWKAWIDRDDADHRIVKKAFAHCAKQHIRLTTSEHVVAETLTLLRLRARLGHTIAVQFGETILQSHVVELVHVTPDIFRRSWDIFRQYHDKHFSFVDCTSFALMEHHRLTTAITLDHHFVQYGFAVVP